MAVHPVHNLIIAMLGPDRSQTIVNLTVPEPGAKRLAGHLSSIGPSSHPEAVKVALKQGFSEIDTAVVNEPGPPVPVQDSPPDHPYPAPEGVPLTQVYRDQLIAIAHGKAYVALDADGEPLIEEGEDPNHAALMNDLADGKVRIVRSETGTPVVDELTGESVIDEMPDNGSAASQG